MASTQRTQPGPEDLAAVAAAFLDALLNEVTRRARDALARPRFLSKPALAKHLGVPERRIKTLREHGLPARKIGRDLYFDLDEVEDFIDRQGSINGR